MESTPDYPLALPCGTVFFYPISSAPEHSIGEREVKDQQALSTSAGFQAKDRPKEQRGKVLQSWSWGYYSELKFLMTEKRT